MNIINNSTTELGDFETEIAKKQMELSELCTKHNLPFMSVIIRPERQGILQQVGANSVDDLLYLMFGINQVLHKMSDGKITVQANL